MRRRQVVPSDHRLRLWLAPSAYFPHRGGVEEVTHQLASELQRRDHLVLVLAPRHPRDLDRRAVVEGVRVVRMPFGAPRRELAALLLYPGLLLVELWRLSRLKAELRPDLVHVHCASVQLPSLTLWCWLTRTPLVVTTHGETKMDADDLYGRSAFMRLALRWAAGRASALTACSGWTALAAAEVAPRFADATVVPNGVDLDQWRVDPVPEAPVICAWGRHVPQKGLDLLISAFALVVDEVPAAQLVIGGSGPETDKLKSAASGNITFVGALDRAGVQRLLSISRVVVVPSRVEPFGVVALEAMAAGRDIVWSTSGGLYEATGGLGRGVDPTSVSELADAVIASLRSVYDPSVLRAHAETMSWAAIGDRYLDVYRSSLSRVEVGHGGRG